MSKLKAIKQMLDKKKVTLSHILQTLDMLETNVRHGILKDLQDEALYKQQELEKLGNELVQAEWVEGSNPDEAGLIANGIVAGIDDLNINSLEKSVLDTHSAVLSVHDWKIKTETAINTIKNSENKEINRVAMVQTLFHRGVLYMGSDPIQANDMFAECLRLIEEEKRYQRDAEISIGWVQYEKSRLTSLIKDTANTNLNFKSVIDKVSDQGGEASLQELREIEVMIKDNMRGLSSPVSKIQPLSRMKPSLEPHPGDELLQRQQDGQQDVINSSHMLHKLKAQVEESVYLPDTAREAWLREIRLLTQLFSGDEGIQAVQWLVDLIQQDIKKHEKSFTEDLMTQNDALIKSLSRSELSSQEKHSISERIMSVLESSLYPAVKQRILDEISHEINLNHDDE